MEILKGFQFQLQRFADLVVSDIADPNGKYNTYGKDWWVVSDDNDGWKISLSSSNAIALIRVEGEHQTWAAALESLSKIDLRNNIVGIVTLPTNKAVTVTGGTNTTSFYLGGGTTYQLTAPSFKTDTANGTLDAIASTGAKILKGDIIIADTAENPTSVTLSGGSLKLGKHSTNATDTTVTSELTGDIVVKADANTANVTVAYETNGEVHVTTTGACTAERSTGSYKFKWTATNSTDNAYITEKGVDRAIGTVVANDNGVVITSGANKEKSVTVKNGTSVTSTATDLTVTKGEITADETNEGIDVNVAAGQTVVYDKLTYAASATGKIAKTNEVTVTAGTASMAEGSSITKVTSNGVAFKTESKTVATFSGTAAAVTAFTGGTIGIAAATAAFDGGDGGTDADLSFTDATATVEGGTTLTITEFSAGTVASSTTGDITVGSTTYDNSGSGALTVRALSASSNGLVSGTVTVDSTNAASKSVKVINSAGNGISDTVTANTGSFTVTAENGTATVSDLGENAIAILTREGQPDITLSYVSETVVKKTVNGESTYYDAQTTYNYASAAALAATTNIKAIKTSNWTNTGTFTFNATGVQDADAKATLKVNSSTSKELTVSEYILGGVNMAEDSAAVKVTDGGTKTKYTASATSVFTAEGAAFTSTAGVISDNTKGELTLTETTSTVLAKGTVNVVATASESTKAVTYQAGTDVTGAKITLGEDKYITLTEANNASGAEDTVLDMGTTQKLTGVDGNATIGMNGITSAELASIKTTGSGTFTLNKVAYVVAGDDNGVTFNLESTNHTADTIESIIGPDNGATVSIAGKFTSSALAVGATGAGTPTARASRRKTASLSHPPTRPREPLRPFTPRGTRSPIMEPSTKSPPWAALPTASSSETTAPRRTTSAL